MDKSKPRSFSVKGPYYWHVRAHCAREKIHMRDYITSLIVQDIGEPLSPVESMTPDLVETEDDTCAAEDLAKAATSLHRSVERYKDKRPSFMQPQTLPKQEEEPNGPPGYVPPIQLF